MSAGCGPMPDLRLFAGDLQSPVYLGAGAVAPATIEIQFQEPVRSNSFEISPELGLLDIDDSDSKIILRLASPMIPGSQYLLSGSVYDESGNTLKFTTKLFGFNPEVPSLRINEFTTQGSGNHPDAVELVALSAGNLAGVVVYEGTPADWKERIVLPSVTVGVGDFVVIHFRPENIPGEVNETSHTRESAGRDASDEAWDFWVAEGNGLPGNNGAIVVCENPGGAVLDAVLYSNRSSESDDRYRGFGTSRFLSQAEELVSIGAWSSAGPTVQPEDAIQPEGSTATRSLCRLPDQDSNSRDDWYIVPTRGLSFGSENSLSIYSP